MITDAAKISAFNNYICSVATETEFLLSDNFVQILEGGQLVQSGKIKRSL